MDYWFRVDLVMLLIGLWVMAVLWLFHLASQYWLQVRYFRREFEDSYHRLTHKVRLVKLSLSLLGAFFICAGALGLLQLAFTQPMALANYFGKQPSTINVNLDLRQAETTKAAAGDDNAVDHSKPDGDGRQAPAPASAWNSSFITVGLVVIAAGILLALAGSLLRDRALRAIGVATILVGLTPTLSGAFKIDNIFKVDRVEVTAPPLTQTVSGVTSYRLIGRVEGFPLGCSDPDSAKCSPFLTYVNLSGNPNRDDLFNNVCKTKGIVLVTGRTDRIGLSNALRIQYDANAGLAQARAEKVKNAVSEHCKKNSDIPTPAIITEIGGPRDTEFVSPKSAKAPNSLESKKDRSVELGVIEESAAPKVISSYSYLSSTGWAFLIAFLVLFLALIGWIVFTRNLSGEIETPLFKLKGEASKKEPQ